MNVIEQIIDVLKQYPAIKYQLRSDAIWTLAPDENGFEAALLVHPGYYTVCLAMWRSGTWNSLTSTLRSALFSAGSQSTTA